MKYLFLIFLIICSFISSASTSTSRKKKISTIGWTEQQDATLLALVTKIGPQNWKLIATYFKNFNAGQCNNRWKQVLNPTLRIGKWTEEEDQLLREKVNEEFTGSNWTAIAKGTGKSSKQCRQRWYNHLDPSIKKKNWTRNEDAILIEAQSKLGNKWTEIAKLLSGRPPNAVKNRWNSNLKKYIITDSEPRTEMEDRPPSKKRPKNTNFNEKMREEAEKYLENFNLESFRRPVTEQKEQKEQKELEEEKYIFDHDIHV